MPPKFMHPLSGALILILLLSLCGCRDAVVLVPIVAPDTNTPDKTSFQVTSNAPNVSRHAYASPTGELVGDDGKPVFLISTAVKWHSLQVFYKNRAEFEGTYPEGFEWLYDSQTSVSMLEQLGCNALNFFSTEVGHRALAPDYSGFGKEDAWDDYTAFIEDYGWEKLKKLPNRQAYTEYLDLIRSANAIPVHYDLQRSLNTGSLTQNPQLVSNLIDPARYFASPGQHPVFCIRYALCNPEARKLIIDMYRHEVETVLACGIKPFVYQLFNESDYKDFSPKNQKSFRQELRKRYHTIFALNKTWRTNFRSFDEVTMGADCVAGKIEFKKFQEQQVVQLAVELRDMLRELDPLAPTFIQVHKGAYRKKWNNFNLYSLNEHMEMISTGTGNYTFSPAEHTDNSIPFKNSVPPSNSLRESLASSCFYRALAHNKPLLSTEAYFAGCGERYKQLKQVFWHEMINGSSYVNMWEWIGYWKPKLKKNRISYGLHNQNVVSPDSWRALSEVRKEIETVSDFFQYRKNRPQAKIACLFSYPTLRLNQALTEGYVQGVAGLSMRHIPVDAILEEQLQNGVYNQYNVILAMGVKNIYPQTDAAMRAFVKNGGTLIVGGNYMNFDEYDNPLSNPLVPLTTIAGEDRKQTLQGIGVDVIDSTYFDSLPAEWEVVTALKGKSLVVSKTLGKGRIVALAGSWSDNGLTEIISSFLHESEVTPSARVRRADSDDLPGNIGVHRADHDGMTAWYFVNYNDEPTLIRVSAPEFRDAVVVNHFDEEAYPVDEETTTILVPPQYHTVIICGSKEKVESRFGHFDDVPPTELRKRRDLLLKDLSKNDNYVRVSDTVDVSKFANYGFDNQQGWPIGSAWYDDKGKHLQRVPFHGNIFKHIKFDIIRFDFNNNKTCIALKSKNFKDAPESVENIPLNGKFHTVAFLHAVTHAKQGETAITYKFDYEDGSSVEVPIRVGREIGDWQVADNPSSMKDNCVWESYGKGFYLYEWKNPYPSKLLKTLSVKSGNGESVPIVVAVSTLPTIFQKSYQDRLELAALMKTAFKKKGNGWHKDGTLHKNEEPAILSTIDDKPLPIPSDRLENAVLRCQVKFGRNKWGKQMPVKGYWWPYVIGTLNGKQARTDTRNTSKMSDRLSVKCKSFRGSEWSELELPLASLLKVKGSDGHDITLDNIDTLVFWNDDSYPIFRDLRIEY